MIKRNSPDDLDLLIGRSRLELRGGAHRHHVQRRFGGAVDDVLGDGVEPAVHHLADAAEVRGHVDDRRIIREVPVQNTRRQSN